MWFEILALVKALGYRGKPVNYFAYGANLDSSVMKRRGMTIDASHPASLTGFRLRFNHEIPFQGVGMASVEADASSQVFGILYTLRGIDEKLMDCYEAYALLRRYRKGHVIIDGKPAFYYFTGAPREGLLPSTNYLDKLLTGYRATLGAKSEFVRQLELQSSTAEWTPQHPPRFLIRDYEKWGKSLLPFLVSYDEICVKIFVFFIFRPAIAQKILPKK